MFRIFLKLLAAIVPEALNAVTLEEKHQSYKVLRIKGRTEIEGTVAVKFVSGHLSVSGAESVKTENLCS